MPKVWEDIELIEEALRDNERKVEEIERKMMRNMSRLNDITHVQPLEMLSNRSRSRSEARKPVSLPSEGSGLEYWRQMYEAQRHLFADSS